MSGDELERNWKRFMRHVQVTQAGACWLWQGYRTPDGHGQFRFLGRTEYAHRALLRMLGQDLTGKVVRHRCDNPACVNPQHLTTGTHTDNVRDRVRAGRSAAGERNGRAKLTWVDVDRIRRAYALGQATLAQLARRFGVDERQVARIVRGEVWCNERRASPFAYREGGNGSNGHD